MSKPSLQLRKENMPGSLKPVFTGLLAHDVIHSLMLSGKLSKQTPASIV